MKNIFVKNKFLSRAISDLALILVSGVIFACKNDAEGESSPSGVPNGKTVKAITATAPSKNQYSGDEIFQSAGIVVKAIYEDDSQGVLSQDKYTITPPDFDRNASGTNTYDVVITLKANAAIKTMVSVTYSKAELTLSSIEVVTKPSKLTYFVGDAFDKSGMVVKAKYSDGSSNTITPQSVAVEGENDGVLSQAGTKTVTVSHNGKTATFTITVNAVEIVSISATNPTKTFYTGNEEFSPAGIVVTGHKNNGSTEVLSRDKYEISNPVFDRSAEGVTPYDVTITLIEKTSITTKVIVTYSKAAAVLKSISIKQNPSETTYFTGDAFDSTGLEVEAVYLENNIEQLPVPVTPDNVSAPDMTTSGTKTVTVTFGGKTASFNITVKAICLESISLNTDGVKKAFYTGDMFNSAGLVVNAVYNDKRKNKTVNPTSVTAEGLTDGKFSEDGTKKVTVTYTEGAVSETDEYSVNVTLLVLESIAIKKNPSKTTYKVGQSLDKTGLVVTASFNNGTTREIEAGDLTCDVTSFTEVAESKTVTVSYTFSGVSETATFTVKVERADLNWRADAYTLQVYTSNTTLGDVTLIATSEKKLTIDSTNKTYDGVTYSARVSTGGTGAVSYRALKFHLYGPATITAYAYSSSAGRPLKLADASGSELGSVEVPKDNLLPLEYAYRGEGEDVYLYSGNSGMYICALKVEYGMPAVKPAGISLNYETLISDLAESTNNKTESLVATLAPSTGITEGWDEITWTTSDSSVASISPATGKTVKVTYGAKKGNATITAKTKNNLTATCNVTVKDSSAPVSGNMIKASDKPLGFAGVNSDFASIGATSYSKGSYSNSVTTRSELVAAVAKGGIIYIDGIIDMTNEGSGSKLPYISDGKIVAPPALDTFVKTNAPDYENYAAWKTAYASACKSNTDDSEYRLCSIKNLYDKYKAIIQLNIKSNTILIGKGENTVVKGGTFSINNVSNVAIRNIKILDAYDPFPHHEITSSGASDGWNSQYDCVVAQGTCSNIWIDHCTFADSMSGSDKNIDYIKNGSDVSDHWNPYDGLCDIKGTQNGITVSYCKFEKHDKALLFCSGTSDNGTKNITLAYNYFAGCKQRLPMVGIANLHEFNNYFDIGDGTYTSDYAIGLRYSAQVVSENNYFTNFIKYSYKDQGIKTISGQPTAKLYKSGDSDNSTSKSNIGSSYITTNRSDLFSVGYSYDLKSASELPVYIPANAGAGTWSVEQ